MKTSNYSTSEIISGIARCYARLSGEMPMGVMSAQRVNYALRQYKSELKRRNIKLDN